MRQSISGWLRTYRPSLIIRCLEHKTDIIVLTGMSATPEYGLYNEHTVRIRLDSNKPFKERWGEATNREALFAPRPIQLAKNLAKAKTMLFEFVPFNANPTTITFNVEGLDQHLSEVAKACGWAAPQSKKITH